VHGYTSLIRPRPHPSSTATSCEHFHDYFSRTDTAVNPQITLLLIANKHFFRTTLFLRTFSWLLQLSKQTFFRQPLTIFQIQLKLFCISEHSLPSQTFSVFFLYIERPNISVPLVCGCLQTCSANFPAYVSVHCKTQFRTFREHFCQTILYSKQTARVRPSPPKNSVIFVVC
jgi:hypothetical protein